MAHLLGFAVVGADGTHFNADGVSNIEHVGVGLYRITFTNSVYNACEIASLGHWETAGYVTAYGVPPFGPFVVEVMTFGSNGAAQDLTFQLLVIAPDPDITTGTVPDVRNLDPERAQSRIEGAGFRWSRVDDQILRKGQPPYVESTDPPENTVAFLGTTVTATVAVLETNNH